ncbi:YitT family protein [Bacillus alkalicellulosilyticus]|uniref:YitT family protein n=1 Tax=Alkalihalobacterium alkalicellulosilyticum TaxID=1912214 RepID=UPI00099676A6|nr:YitT family protein [Bacillus alkalicellulosilyticus]
MWKAVQAVVIGSIIIGLGINLFFIPYHILDGGIIGLGLIFHYLWDIEVGLTIVIISIPIYIFAWKSYRTFFYTSIPGLLVSALFIDLLSFLTNYAPLLGPLSSSLVGGLLLGVGVGIMFLYDISTGGLDLLAQMAAEATKINVGVMIFIVDMIVVGFGWFVVTPQEIVLSTIAVTATGLATTIITGGHHSPKRSS